MNVSKNVQKLLVKSHQERYRFLLLEKQVEDVLKENWHFMKKSQKVIEKTKKLR